MSFSIVDSKVKNYTRPIYEVIINRDQIVQPVFQPLQEQKVQNEIVDNQSQAQSHDQPQGQSQPQNQPFILEKRKPFQLKSRERFQTRRMLTPPVSTEVVKPIPQIVQPLPPTPVPLVQLPPQPQPPQPQPPQPPQPQPPQPQISQAPPSSEEQEQEFDEFGYPNDDI